MKRKVNFRFLFIVIILVGIITLLYGRITGLTIEENEASVDSKISEFFKEENDNMNVIVKLKDKIGVGGFLGMPITDKVPVSRQEVIEKTGIKDKVKYKHLFSNSFSASLTRQEIETLAKDSRVEYIYYDYPVRAFLQDSVPLINATETWNFRVEGTNLTGKHHAVCVIDTGVDYNHSDLGGCFGENDASSSCRVLGGHDFVNNDTNPLDDNGHGTHVSGIVAANGSAGGLKGTAPDTKIIAIKSLDAAGSGSFSGVDAGIEWCTNNATAFNITVISMSLGTDCTDNPELCYDNFADCESDFPSTVSAINAAVAKNISVVIATGNDNNVTHISSPACIKNATRVGSTTKSDSISSFSNRWALDMLVAPGSSINSTKLNGGYEIKSGTSMATPHVAGAIAILNQYLNLTKKSKNTTEIFEILNETGKFLNDSSGNNLNYSRIDIHEAIIFLDTSPAINFTVPTESNGTRLGRNYIQVNVTAEDINTDAITIRLYNSTFLVQENTSTASPFFVNFTNLAEGTYEFNATANDTEGNENSTETRQVTLTKPIINLVLPKNETYITNESLLFNFTAQAEDNVWYNIDGSENVTIETNVTFNITEGTHTLNLFANNTFGENSSSVNFTINLSLFSVGYSNFSGETTDFNKVSFEELQNLSEIILEDTDFGKINFNEAINLTNVSGNELDFDKHINISDNRIELNSTALQNFNKSATLRFYNLTFSNPRILRNGGVCPESICTELSYTGGIFTFNVNHFTVYSSEETPVSSSDDGSGSGSGGGSGGIAIQTQENDTTDNENQTEQSEIDESNETKEDIFNESDESTGFKLDKIQTYFVILTLIGVILVSIILPKVLKAKKSGKKTKKS